MILPRIPASHHNKLEDRKGQHTPGRPAKRILRIPKLILVSFKDALSA